MFYAVRLGQVYSAPKTDIDSLLPGIAPSPLGPRRTMLPPLLGALVGARPSTALQWPLYVVSPRPS